MGLKPNKIPDTSQEVLLMSKYQLNRMVEQMHEEETNAKKAEAITNARKSIRDASKKMTDTWTNTFAGLHKERLKNIELKELTVEAERRQTDDKEGKFQELRRKYVLDLAKEKLYLETDRVKRLHAAMHLAETLKERDDQRAGQEHSKHIFDKYNAAFDRCILADVEKCYEEQHASMEKEQQNKKKTAVDLKKQSFVTQRKKDQERVEDLQMTRMLQDLNQEYDEEAHSKTLIEKEGRLSYRRSLDREVQQKKELESVLKKMNELEDKRCTLFNEAKLKMKNQHKEHEKGRNELLNKRNKILTDKLKELKGNMCAIEERICQKAIKEKEAQRIEQERKKEAKRNKALKDIDAHLKEKIAEKEATSLKAKAQSVAEGIYLHNLYLQQTEKEEKELKQISNRAKTNEHTVLHQMSKKKKEKTEKSMNDMDEYMRHMKSLKEEEETFQRYAKQLIEKCEAKGLNTYPVKKAALPGIECGKGPLRKERGSIRLKYYAAVQDPDELHYVKPRGKSNSDEIKARLGFTGI